MGCTNLYETIMDCQIVPNRILPRSLIGTCSIICIFLHDICVDLSKCDFLLVARFYSLVYNEVVRIRGFCILILRIVHLLFSFAGDRSSLEQSSSKQASCKFVMNVHSGPTSAMSVAGTRGLLCKTLKKNKIISKTKNTCGGGAGGGADPMDGIRRFL